MKKTVMFSAVACCGLMLVGCSGGRSSKPNVDVQVEELGDATTQVIVTALENNVVLKSVKPNDGNCPMSGFPGKALSQNLSTGGQDWFLTPSTCTVVKVSVTTNGGSWSWIVRGGSVSLDTK